MNQTYRVKNLTADEVAGYLDALWTEIYRNQETQKRVRGYDPSLMPKDWKDAVEFRLEGEGLSAEMVVLLIIFKKGFAAAAGAKAAQMIYDIWQLALERIRKDRGRDSILLKEPEGNKDPKTS
jgi:hypothetical protein